MKYIDAEKLKETINKRLQENADKALLFGAAFAGRTAEDNDIINLIASLQQEQPEVDLEKEVENFCLEYDSRKDAWYNMTPQDQKLLSNPTWLNFAINIARHFYDLGLNARKL